MTTITSLDLRNNLESYLEQAYNGQNFVITFRGKAKANLSFGKINQVNKTPKPKSGKAFLEKIKNSEKIDWSDSPTYNMTVKEEKEYIRSERTKKYGYE